MFRFVLTLAIALALAVTVRAVDYPIVDTDQTKFYGNEDEITKPGSADAFFGQDAQFTRNPPDYFDHGDDTVSDFVTHLMWMKGTISTKMTYAEASSHVLTFSHAGFVDWRIPTIRELYSLILFSGIDIDPQATSGTTPFINQSVFDFAYGDTSTERIIDAQYLSSTKYVSTTMNNADTVFGVNFADGRIKGYPADAKAFYVKYVRGPPNYGINSFVNNEDGTITDAATGLMWSQGDSGEAMNWEKALEWVATQNTRKWLGYDDWRLPNIKELHSILDYTRSPATSQTAAIDPMFSTSKITDEGGNEDYPFFWSGTTHLHSGAKPATDACYMAFGRALGFMSIPPTASPTLMDVHGAGAQRSDPKTGDPADYPTGKGPQGDVIRIFNYVRVVRDASGTSSTSSTTSTTTKDPLAASACLTSMFVVAAVMLVNWFVL